MKLRGVLAWALTAVLLSSFGSARAQQPAARLAGPVTGGPQVVLGGSRPARVAMAQDLGSVSNDMALQGITLVFKRTAAQEADLQTLLAAQQDPTSPQYHQWLTPDQFAARFGVADSDIAKVETWLQAEGFSVDRVARSRNHINFSGQASQVAQAFGAALHYYNVDGAKHFAPVQDLAVPSALGSLVSTVLNVSDLRPHSALRHMVPATQSNFTSNVTQDNYLTPLDIATMYDLNSVYSSGFNGSGQSIAVIAQSLIDPTDVARFQKAAGLPSNLPTMVLVPNTGVASIEQDGDEAESDLDVEYAAGIARGASIFLVYTGDSPNSQGAFQSLMYAVDEDIAPVISSSYTDCEYDANLEQGGSLVSSMSSLAAQANAQGQTIVAATGDSGSTACYGYTNLLNSQQYGLSVNVPGDLANVTGMGGTQMASGDSTGGNTTYWTAASGSDVVSSLKSYVPEVVWNEDSSAYGLSSGGGGSSLYVARPSWQTGVPGIPAGNYRLVPDLSLLSASGTPGYLLCTSDASALQSFNISSTCTNGFRDSATGVLVGGYGGTSFAAPIFAGMVAILNQATRSNGQGNINPTLYSLASNATTYASVFHDITSGTNACTAGIQYCTTAGASGFSAGTGYDQATGLGSVDFAKLLAAWPTYSASPTLATSTTTVTAATATPAVNASDTFTVTVAGSAGGATPTGTVQLLVDGSAVNSSLPLTNGQATFTQPGFATTGSHVVKAIYAGNGTYAQSSGAVSVTVGTTVTSGTFTLSASNITLSTNNYSGGTVTVVPGSGYTGVVNFTVTFPSGATGLCYAALPVNSLVSPTTTTLYIGQGTECSTTGDPQFRKGTGAQAAAAQRPRPGTRHEVPALTAFAGLIMAGFAFGRRSRKLPLLLLTGLLSAAGLGLSGCSGGTTTGVPIRTQSSSYTVTLVGTDSVTSSITSSTTLTVTVD